MNRKKLILMSFLLLTILLSLTNIKAEDCIKEEDNTKNFEIHKYTGYIKNIDYSSKEEIITIYMKQTYGEDITLEFHNVLMNKYSTLTKYKEESTRVKITAIELCQNNTCKCEIIEIQYKTPSSFDFFKGIITGFLVLIIIIITFIGIVGL